MGVDGRESGGRRELDNGGGTGEDQAANNQGRSDQQENRDTDGAARSEQDGYKERGRRWTGLAGGADMSGTGSGSIIELWLAPAGGQSW